MKSWSIARGHTRTVIAALVLSTALSGCQMIDTSTGSFMPSSNPVTVDSVTRGNRLARQAGQQHPRILQTYGGEYSDPKLERMVARVVGSLTLDEQNTAPAYRITILNSPNVNAFALPGGYLYVTRGLLALANDSAELAAVLAHEMAHVTANHGIERQKMEAEEQFATKVVNEVLGEDPVAQTALVRGKLRLAQFSRNQELEADRIGIRTVAHSGYDAFAAARFLQAMDAYQGFRSVSGATDASLDFLASHPNAPRRIELAQRHARELEQPGSGKRDRDPFLAGIDGMVYGDSPEEGYVRGRDFLHPGLGVAFRVPEGFVIDNSATAVTAVGPGDVAVRFDGATVPESTSLTQYLTSGWVAGLEPGTIREFSLNGRPAAKARAAADNWQFDVTVIRSGGQVYRLLTAAPATSTELNQVANEVGQSFRILNDAEKAGLKPLRIRVVTVKPGETLGSLAAQMRGVDRKVELFRLLNAISPGGTPSVGSKVKIITDS
ncbi:M48 family metalloprotease [Nitratireductor sp. ZSWI3]|uniref:M48 family metalloprotease n=1 Tax=Nitratireductor sp. ZSWI3 TaxID=2966359 RepID=UPI00214FA9AF|nr:M48 family metalloprotease [Nitratireductor sp. ZSWI3]MCR4266581.1 M48 family metalloprotease [Nitratireductor sp. ZSWI3]